MKYTSGLLKFKYMRNCFFRRNAVANTLQSYSKASDFMIFKEKILVNSRRREWMTLGAARQHTLHDGNIHILQRVGGQLRIMFSIIGTAQYIFKNRIVFRFHQSSDLFLFQFIMNRKKQSVDIGRGGLI